MDVKTKTILETLKALEAPNTYVQLYPESPEMVKEYAERLRSMGFNARRCQDGYVDIRRFSVKINGQTIEKKTYEQFAIDIGLAVLEAFKTKPYEVLFLWEDEVYEMVKKAITDVGFVWDEIQEKCEIDHVHEWIVIVSRAQT
jgi:hypothetical protein